MPRRTHTATRLYRATMLVGLCATGTLRAAVDTTWTGPTGGNWSEPTNWSGAVVPINDATTTYNVIIDATAGSKTALLDLPVTIDNLTISTGDVLSISGGQTLTLAGTSISNSGTISLVPAGAISQLSLSGATLTLSGAGQIDMVGTGAPAQISGAGTLVTNNNIRGQGFIGLIGVINSGTIAADAAGQNLYLSPTGIFTSSGTLLATGGGSMLISSPVTLANTGTLLAQAGSTISIGAGGVAGGTLSASGGGVIENASDGSILLSDVANSGNFAVRDRSETYIAGAITNSGSINLDSTFTAFEFTDLLLQSGSTVNLTGGGSINLGAVGVRIRGLGTLVSNNTIHGSAQLFNIGLVNSGTIAADTLGSSLSVAPLGIFTNSGRLIASNGGFLQLSSSATLTNTGTLLAQTGSTISMSSGGVTGGTLSTSGTGVIENASGGSILLTTLTNSGNFAARDRTATYLAGVITNSGSINLNSTLTPGQFTDLLLQSGSTVTLGGSGSVNLASTAIRIRGSGTLNSNNTIHGSATLSGIGLVNSATISSDAPGSVLSISPTGIFTNSGRLIASNGGYLLLTPSITMTNTGTILANGGSSIDLGGGGTISGGTLSTAGDGVIGTLPSSSIILRNLNNTTTYLARDNSTTALSGTLSNNATINVGSLAAATLSLVSGTVTVSGTGRINLQGPGAIITGTGTLNSTNTIRGAGTITGIGLVNNATATISSDVAGSFIQFAPTGIFTNNGTIQATNGATIAIAASATLTNNGTLKADNGSTISLFNTIQNGTLLQVGTGRIQVDAFAVATLSNVTNIGNLILYGGSVATFSGNIVNNSTITLNPTGTLTLLNSGPSTTTFSGNGTINLSGQSNIFGSGTLVSSNTIHGSGNIGLNFISLVNNNLIAADIPGAPLNIDTSVQLTNNGTIRAEAGTRLNIADSFIVNFGTIMAIGGSTLGFSGIGTINGGALSTSGGSIVEMFSGGLALNSVTQSGTFIAQGSASVALTGSAITSGSMTFGTGANLSATGALNAIGGRVQINAGGSLTSNAAITGGTFVLDGRWTYNGGNSFVDTISGNGTVALAAGSLSAQSIRVGTVSIASGGAVTVPPNGGPAGASKVAFSLTINGTGKLDLTDNDLVLDYLAANPIPLSSIRAKLAAAYDAGLWDGPGITSSSAAFGAGRTALGYRDSLSMLGAGGGIFSGLPADDTAVLIKYTYYGDATLDGDVDLDDLYALSSNWNLPGTWDDGDFNYDGIVDANDLGLLSYNWQQGVGAPLGSDLSGALTSVGLPLMSVPEPALILALLPTCAAWSLQRRRKRHRAHRSLTPTQTAH